MTDTDGCGLVWTKQCFGPLNSEILSVFLISSSITTPNGGGAWQYFAAPKISSVISVPSVAKLLPPLIKCL